MSFGFSKRPPPAEANVVWDVRFLPDPHDLAELAPLTGRDPAVGEYLEAVAGASEFVDSLTATLRLDLSVEPGRTVSPVRVAVGCVGGQHRSVWVVESLAARLRAADVSVDVCHIELDGEPVHSQNGV